MQRMLCDWTILASVSVIIYLHLEIENAGGLRANLYDTRDGFTFPIVNFPFISSNIPAAPAYRVYILQLRHHSKDCAHAVNAKSTQEEFEYTKGVIEIRNLAKDKQHNGQKKKDKERSTKHT